MDLLKSCLFLIFLFSCKNGISYDMNLILLYNIFQCVRHQEFCCNAHQKKCHYCTSVPPNFNLYSGYSYNWQKENIFKKNDRNTESDIVCWQYIYINRMGNMHGIVYVIYSILKTSEAKQKLTTAGATGCTVSNSVIICEFSTCPRLITALTCFQKAFGFNLVSCVNYSKVVGWMYYSCMFQLLPC